MDTTEKLVFEKSATIFHWKAKLISDFYDLSKYNEYPRSEVLKYFQDFFENGSTMSLTSTEKSLLTYLLYYLNVNIEYI